MHPLQRELLGRVKFHVNSSDDSPSVKPVLDIILVNNGALPIDKKSPSKGDLSKTLDTINSFIREFMQGRSEIWYTTADTRDTIALLIVSFFAITHYPSCKVCNQSSIETLCLGSPDVIRCLCCGIPVHPGCYPEVDPKKGIFFNCGSCNFDSHRNLPPSPHQENSMRTDRPPDNNHPYPVQIETSATAAVDVAVKEDNTESDVTVTADPIEMKVEEDPTIEDLKKSVPEGHLSNTGNFTLAAYAQYT